MEPEIEPIFKGKWAARIALLLFLGTAALIAWLWFQDSEHPPPGSDLPDAVLVTATPQVPVATYVRR